MGQVQLSSRERVVQKLGILSRAPVTLYKNLPTRTELRAMYKKYRDLRMSAYNRGVKGDTDATFAYYGLDESFLY